MNAVADPHTSEAKVQARGTYRGAVARGVVAAPVLCEVCGTTVDVEAHHPDYARPLFVVGLCRPHHREVHAGLRPEPRTGRVLSPSTRYLPGTECGEVAHDPR